MAVNIHQIKGVKFAIALNIARANKIRLVNIVYLKCLCKIRVLNALGDVSRFFLIKPSRFKTRLMVRSDGKAQPALFSSHLIAEAPI